MKQKLRKLGFGQYQIFGIVECKFFPKIFGFYCKYGFDKNQKGKRKF